MVQGLDGDLYGTTVSGGVSNGGTVFKMTTSGALTTLYNFCSQANCADGVRPSGALVQAPNGELYGTTFLGGAHHGTVFKITPSGTLTTLYSFCSQANCADGGGPQGLVQATNGELYGTTYYGGVNCQAASECGTVFKITPSGTLTILYSFCSQANCADGSGPAGLVQATSGELYGTTVNGGVNGGVNCQAASGCGTVFKITPSGTLAAVYSFCSQANCADGAFPQTGLVQATNGELYGTTGGGGGNLQQCTFNGVPGCGTAFRITPGGALTTLYNFCSQGGCADGSCPLGPLIQATNGELYGTTAFPQGTVFQISPSGTLATLYSFCSQANCADGQFPEASLFQATNGDLYGTTAYGGTSNQCRYAYSGQRCGTVFSLSVGLGPFVESLPGSGSVDSTVKILGTNLTGATGVTFNGAAAVFKLAAPSLITTTVPAGATTGKIQVVTPTGTLSSNVAFRVRP